MSTNTAATPATDTARSGVEDALWAALAANPGSNATELADATPSVSASRARKILGTWAGQGLITRDTANEDPRSGHRWTIPETTAPEPETDSPATESDTPDTDTDGAAATDAAPVADTPPPASDPETDTEIEEDAAAGEAEPEPTPTQPVTGAEPAATEAAPATGLCPTCGRKMPKSPGSQSGVLRGLVEDYLRDHPGQEFTPGQIAKALQRSSGAVYNALFSLVGKFVAQETCESPHRFQLHPDQARQQEQEQQN
ncbi:hypothetical protein ACFXHA_45475 [Nocardia sp. NPDC059240]|uniref:hypothetical protein n=1 Tax=Nocardia sp. NPDC059240 TaxID=3346786 RepID=UPI0036A39810